MSQSSPGQPLKDQGLQAPPWTFWTQVLSCTHVGSLKSADPKILHAQQDGSTGLAAATRKVSMEALPDDESPSRRLLIDKLEEPTYGGQCSAIERGIGNLILYSRGLSDSKMGVNIRPT